MPFGVEKVALLGAAGGGAAPIEATGGSTSTSGDYTIHTFTGSGTFEVTAGAGDVDVLVVAGGGSGAGWSPDSWANHGGGGGGGAQTATIAVEVGSYTVTVGAGGATYNNNGANSVFGPTTSTGGGFGGWVAYPSQSGGASGNPGGSGGGGGGYNTGVNVTAAVLGLVAKATPGGIGTQYPGQYGNGGGGGGGGGSGGNAVINPSPHKAATRHLETEAQVSPTPIRDLLATTQEVAAAPLMAQANSVLAVPAAVAQALLQADLHPLALMEQQTLVAEAAEAATPTTVTAQVAQASSSLDT